MIEIVWQYDSSAQKPDPAPASAGEARRLLMASTTCTIAWWADRPEKLTPAIGRRDYFLLRKMRMALLG
jgi:hypothetical protein